MTSQQQTDKPRQVPMYNPSPAAPVFNVTPQPYYAQPVPPPTTQSTNSFWYALTSPLRPLTYQLVLFHLINFVFAVVAFVVAVALGSIGVATVPLFCLGVLVLQVLLYAIHFFAQCDARLYNCIAPADEHITVQFDVPRHGLYHLQGYRISPTLSNFS
ncbi:hypothetical protein As57867_014906, partial [Aphanomyces stellatus]